MDKFIIELNSRLLPFYRWFVDTFVKTVYRAKFIGFDQIPKEGAALLICNHVSYVDGLFIQAGCKRQIRFIIDKEIYEIPLVNYFMKLDRGIPIAPNKADVTAAMDEIKTSLENGEIVCIFPEGELTHSGMIGVFKPGIEWIVNKTPVPVYPIALNGLWGSALSRKHAKIERKLLPRSFRMKVTARMGSPIEPEKVKTRDLQKIVSDLFNA